MRRQNLIMTTTTKKQNKNRDQKFKQKFEQKIEQNYNFKSAKIFTSTILILLTIQNLFKKFSHPMMKIWEKMMKPKQTATKKEKTEKEVLEGKIRKSATMNNKSRRSSPVTKIAMAVITLSILIKAT